MKVHLKFIIFNAFLFTYSKLFFGIFVYVPSHQLLYMLNVTTLLQKTTKCTLYTFKKIVVSVITNALYSQR